MINEQERIIRKSQGYDIGFELNGKKYWLNSDTWNNEKEVRLFQETGLRSFRETTGNKNLVLYNPKYFSQVRGSLLYIGTVEKDIPQPINMSSAYTMFALQKAIQFDLSSWDMSNVLCLYGMFSSCDNLQTVNLDGWDVKNVLEFNCMFIHCKRLQALDLSNWKTGNGVVYCLMFADCEELHTLDLSNWNMSKGLDLRNMFHDCKSLTSLNLENWEVNINANIKRLFDGCDVLYEKYDTNNNSVLLKRIIKSSNANRKPLEQLNTF